jgi:hypothetical protein
MALVLSAPLALAFVPSLILTNFRGTLQISQGVPCGGVAEVTTTVADGRMDITPSFVRGDVIGAPVQFNITRLDMFYTPFSVHHECNGLAATAVFSEIGLRLAKSVKFTGEQIGERRYRFSIPKEQFPIFESITSNLPGVQQPETRYVRPSEDVTGEIDLGRGTSRLHIALASRMHFRAGCVRKRCIIDETLDGTQVSDVAGSLYVPGTDTDSDGTPDLVDNCPLVPNPSQSPVATPVITAPPNVTLSSCQATGIGTATAEDVCHARPVAISNNAPARFAVGPNLVTWSGNDGIDPIVTAQQTVTVTGDSAPPTASCTAVQPLGGSFKVAAADNCAGPTTLKLGSFTLGNNEVIKIQETGKPGVRLINTVGPDNIRHFQVGKGEAQILATDAAGNIARAICR